MMTRVSGVLKQHGITFLRLDGYSVRLIESNVTPLGAFPVVLIQSDRVSTDPHCPACGSDVCGYLAGDKVVMVMCQDCGCIYEFKEAGIGENPSNAG